MIIEDEVVLKRRGVMIDGEPLAPPIHGQHVQQGSSSGSSFKRSGYATSDYSTPNVCGCNKKVIMLISKTKENPNRPFWRCPRYKNEDLCCGFFQWVDNFEGVVPRTPGSYTTDDKRVLKLQKKIIKGLQSEVMKLRIACTLLIVLVFIVLFLAKWK